MMDERKLRQDILSSLDSNKVENLSVQILNTYKTSKPEKKTPWYKNKALYFIGSPILAGGVALAIVLPLTMHGNNSNILPPISGDYVPVTIQGEENEIAFSVLSAFNIVSSDNNKISPLLKRRISENDFKENITLLNPYMSTSETMLKNNLDVKPTIYQITDPASKWEYQMSIDDHGTIIEFYYNQTDITDVDEDDDEKEYRLDGQFIVNSTVYHVSGGKELEEDEYELTLKVELNSNSYLLIEQEVETEQDEHEESYLYSLYENNRQQFLVELSFEQEQNEEKVVEVKIEQNRKESEYCIMFSQDPNHDFIMSYEMDDEEGLIDIDVVEQSNESYYQYIEKNLGYIIQLKRN